MTWLDHLTQIIPLVATPLLISLAMILPELPADTKEENCRE